MLVAFTALLVSQLAIAALLFGTLAIDRPEVVAAEGDRAPAPFHLRPAAPAAVAPEPASMVAAAQAA